MRRFFDLVTRAALRFRAITIALVVIIISLGAVSATQLQQELLPPVEFPQTFILAQTSGMTSAEALQVVTLRLEEAIAQVPDVVNIESQTSSGITFFTVSNDFGLNQERLQSEIQAAIDSVWFPRRVIEPAEDVVVETFTAELLGDLSADSLVYIAERNSNFLFQLSPDVWQSLSDETVRSLLVHLANRQAETADQKSALQQLVEKQVLPQLESVDIIASVDIAGGQSLPDEDGETAELVAQDEPEEAEGESLLLQLAPEVWGVVGERFDDLDALDEAAVETLLAEDLVNIAEDSVPVLPESWQVDHFNDVTDLLEMATLTRTIAAVFNDFVETGRISGALAQTDDLTPETVTRLLEIEPGLAQYFEADQLVAMPAEVFALLPQELDLDGFSRDELAAASLARSLTNEDAERDPVDLPTAWRIQPPQLISFSFADLPLATYSVFSTGVPVVEDASTDEEVAEEPEETQTEAAETEPEDVNQTEDTATSDLDLPEGPALPQLLEVFAAFAGDDIELDTADDLITLQLPDEFADFAGASNGAGILNLLPQLGQFAGQLGAVDTGNAETDAAADAFAFGPAEIAQLTAGLVECEINLADLGVNLFNLDLANFDFDALTAGLIGCLDADTFTYIVENDPTFVSSLSPEVYQYLSPEVLAVDGISPLLGEAWTTLSAQPQFADVSLRSADDLLALGDGSASAVLDLIDEEVPERFAGYEVRLFDSLTPTVLQYLAAQEEGFYSNLIDDVLLKFSPEALASLPEEVLNDLDVELVETLQAIASGEQPSAASELASEYTSDVPPARPDAPALNPEWQTLSTFLNLELNNAYDLFRRPDPSSAGQFVNGFFNSAQGAAFAEGLLGNLSQEAFDYIVNEDPNFIGELQPRALNLLSDDVYASLPETAKERAEAGQVFVPVTQVTRTNGAPSLLVTVFKVSEANTVEAFYAVDEVIQQVNAENDNIEVEVAFEQSSFIESSITGVVREGTLGAFFAIINILIFLSGGIWGRRGRLITGAAVIVVALAFLGILFVLSGNDVNAMFAGETVLFSVLGVLGVVAGVGIMIFPGRLPYPSWRSTLVIGVSIPLSIFAALALMRWLPPFVNGIFAPMAETSAIAAFILKLAPDNLTLNIMTLSGLTVAVGRLVDDSIVVLENIFRQIQTGMDKREAVLSGVRDVSVAIFSATSIAVVVFLPLGLTGGLIAEFFLPFGLAVTYTLLSSFLTAITVVPVMAYIFISKDNVPEEAETWMQRAYVPTLKWVIDTGWRRWLVVMFAVLSVAFGGFLFSQRPAAFLPDFGEPQLSASVSLPQGTSIIQTNERVEALEQIIVDVIPEEDLSTVRTIIGGGGLDFSALLGGGGVTENIADVTVSVNSQDQLAVYAEAIVAAASDIFAEDELSVSAGTLSDGGFGGFQLVMSGADQETLAQFDQQVIDALESVEGLLDVSSNLTQTEDADSDSATIIRIRNKTSEALVDGSPAISYTGTPETQDTINLTQDALDAVAAQVDLPEGVTIGQGFDSELQTEGFAGIFVAMGIALVIVVLILVVVFGSPIYWLAVIFSVIVAPVGAAIALTISDRVLGISALIGLLMLLGLVVTNAVVLIDRVSSNRRERGMDLKDAIVEAGSRRVRPILMTALTTIIALIPLSLGLSEGAIIAAELGTVVIGGIVSSTLLTLIVVPAAYYLVTPIHDWFTRLFGRGGNSVETVAEDKQK